MIERGTKPGAAMSATRIAAETASAAREVRVELRTKRPLGRTRITARNTRCPASCCHSGLIVAPIACDMPSTMPPRSVPQKLPRPPNKAADWEGTDPAKAGGRFQSWGASGLAGVWAEENSREAIYAAMRRKETF
eukprot:gene37745-50954_t